VAASRMTSSGKVEVVASDRVPGILKEHEVMATTMKGMVDEPPPNSERFMLLGVVSEITEGRFDAPAIALRHPGSGLERTINTFPNNKPSAIADMKIGDKILMTSMVVKEVSGGGERKTSYFANTTCWTNIYDEPVATQVLAMFAPTFDGESSLRSRGVSSYTINEEKLVSLADAVAKGGSTKAYVYGLNDDSRVLPKPACNCAVFQGDPDWAEKAFADPCRIDKDHLRCTGCGKMAEARFCSSIIVNTLPVSDSAAEGDSLEVVKIWNNVLVDLVEYGATATVAGRSEAHRSRPKPAPQAINFDDVAIVSHFDCLRKAEEIVAVLQDKTARDGLLLHIDHGTVVAARRVQPTSTGSEPSLNAPGSSPPRPSTSDDASEALSTTTTPERVRTVPQPRVSPDTVTPSVAARAADVATQRSAKRPRRSAPITSSTTQPR
jgi:hypothetical protein